MDKDNKTESLGENPTLEQWIKQNPFAQLAFKLGISIGMSKIMTDDTISKELIGYAKTGNGEAFKNRIKEISEQELKAL